MKAQVPRWVDRLRRAGGLKGPAESEVLPDLQPSIQLDDLSRTPYKWLSRDFVGRANFSVTAAAGQFATCGINFNPVPPADYLLWIRRLYINAGAASGGHLWRQGTGFGVTTGQTIMSRDSRADQQSLTGFLAGLVDAFTASAAAINPVGERMAQLRFLANDAQQIEIDTVLASGQSFGAQLTTVALTLEGFWDFELLAREFSER